MNDFIYNIYILNNNFNFKINTNDSILYIFQK